MPKNLGGNILLFFLALNTPKSHLGVSNASNLHYLGGPKCKKLKKKSSNIFCCSKWPKKSFGWFIPTATGKSGNLGYLRETPGKRVAVDKK